MDSAPKITTYVLTYKGKIITPDLILKVSGVRQNYGRTKVCPRLADVKAAFKQLPDVMKKDTEIWECAPVQKIVVDF